MATLQIQRTLLLSGVFALFVGSVLSGCDSKVPQSGLTSGTSGSASSQTTGTDGTTATASTAGTTTTGSATTGSSTANPAQNPTDSNPKTQAMLKELTAEAAKLDPDTIATLKTNLGTIVIRFFKDKAPITVANFQKLAKDGFYDKTKFHRVIPGFMIQGGDPNSKGSDRSTMGTGDPGYSIPAEFNNVDFKRGIVGMARSSDPNSGGSQFFIMQKDGAFLNNQYTAFGQVLSGLDVVDKIVNLKRDSNDNPLDSNPAILESVKLSKGDPKTFPEIPLIKS